AFHWGALGAERRAHQANGGFALRLAHLLEADTLPQIEMLVHPLAPLRVVHWKHGLRTKFGAQRREKGVGAVADGFGGTPRETDAEYPWTHAATRCHALERLGQSLGFRLGRHLSIALH